MRASLKNPSQFLATATVIPLFALLALLPGGQHLLEATPGNPSMRAYRVSAPPVLDGVVDDSWMSMEPATGFKQQLPETGAPATERVEVRIGFDRNTLFIGVICFDSRPEEIVSTQARRDGVLNETDSFEVLLDTYDDDQSGFLFATTPGGIEFDAQIIHGGQSRAGGGPGRAGSVGGSGFGGAQGGQASAFNLNWDAVWTVQAKITPRGWEAEFAIPLRSLRYEPGADRTWGVNFKRNLRRKNEQSYWAPVTRGFEIHRVSMAGDLTGLDLDFRPSRQVIPYVKGGFLHDYRGSDPLKDGILDAGLDLKTTLTPTLTLDATLNTDFSQVEVDEEQVNLTRFDLFFPEKRPFFLENAGYFQVGSPRQAELFFSRRIGIDPTGVEVPILGGARLTGKLDRFNLGVLNMQTNDVEEVTPAHNFTVLRVAREVGSRSAFGAIFINKVATGTAARPNQFNRTYGMDANIGIGERWTFFNYAARTETPGLDGRDHAASSEVRYATDFFSWDVGYLEVGEDFNPEVGFVPRSGYRKPSYGIYFNPRPKNHPFFRRFWPHHSWRGHYRFDGSPESGWRHNDMRVFFQNGGSVGLAYNQNFEQLFEPFEIFEDVVLPKGRYHFDNFLLTVESDESADLFGVANYSWGEFYSGHIKTLSLRAGFRVGAEFLLAARYVRNGVELPEGRFNTDLAMVQLNYSFTPKSYIQSLIQYNSTEREIGANIRFALLRTGSTGFFIVYNSHFDPTGIDPHEGPMVPGPYRTQRTLDRTILAKFTYLLDF
ncbi:MAG: DUF5916 domain-containing protein [Acidobacteriota bacterium]|nr:DUF5916 domain-containing protein [Acidobacteriota bacterium]